MRFEAYALPVILASLLGLHDRIDAQNIISLPSHTVEVGQQLVVHPILGAHMVQVRSFQIAMEFDHSVIGIVNVDVINTDLNQVPDWFVYETRQVGGVSELVIGVILDLTVPFDLLPPAAPGTEQVLANVHYAVDPAATPGTSTDTLVVVPSAWNPVVITNFVDQFGFSLVTTVENGPLTIEVPTVLDYIRGDTNGDGTLDIADPIVVLSHLFNAVSLSCRAAADGNADGALNIADVIYLLYGTVGQGPLPSAPFPNCGPEPGGNGLECDFHPAC